MKGAIRLLLAAAWEVDLLPDTNSRELRAIKYPGVFSHDRSNAGVAGASDLPVHRRFYGVHGAMFDEIVDEDTKAELLDGVMIVHSPATMEHDDIGGFIRALTSCYVDSKGSVKVYGPGLPGSPGHLSAVRAGRVLPPPEACARRRPKQFEGAPDWLMGGVVAVQPRG